LSDPTYNITDTQLGQAKDELHAQWRDYTAAHPGFDAVCAHRLFGLDPDSPVCDLEGLDRQAHTVRQVTYKLYNRMVAAGMIDPEDPSDDNGRSLTLIAHMIDRNAEMVRASFHLKDCATDNYSASKTNSTQLWTLKMGASMAGDQDDVANLAPTQRFLLNVLEMAYKKNFRKHQGYLLKQVIIEGNRTHAWETHCSIEEFLYECSNKSQDFELWKDFTSGARLVDFANTYITNSTQDMELLSLKPSRHIFSFSNGVYDALNNKHYPYSEGNIPDCHLQVL
jgi:hypothetical protein